MEWKGFMILLRSFSTFFENLEEDWHLKIDWN